MKQISIILACVLIQMLCACSSKLKSTQEQTKETEPRSEYIDSQEPVTIYIANIGNLDRGELAEKIEILQKFTPKAIGIDAVYKDRKDKAKDERLKEALNLRRNIVLGAFAEFKKNGQASGITTTNHYFGDLPFGFCELTINEDNEAECIDKQINIKKKKTFYPLSAEVIRMFDPNAFEYYKNNTGEIYEFKYNENSDEENINIVEIDFEEIRSNSDDLKKINDGIVLLGYLGNDQNTRHEKDSVDNFIYTDLSGKHIVKGVKIHAYIIGKILNEYNKSKN